jgi:hypothetical protein
MRGPLINLWRLGIFAGRLKKRAEDPVDPRVDEVSPHRVTINLLCVRALRCSSTSRLARLLLALGQDLAAAFPNWAIPVPDAGCDQSSDQAAAEERSRISPRSRST